MKEKMLPLKSLISVDVQRSTLTEAQIAKVKKIREDMEFHVSILLLHLH